MPGGRLNTNGRLETGRPWTSRTIQPPEPDYAADAQRFRERQVKKKNEQKLSDAGRHEVSNGRGGTVFRINDLNFVIMYGTHKGKQLGFVIKKDPEFIRNLIRSGDYEIAEGVLKRLIKEGILKR